MKKTLLAALIAAPLSVLAPAALAADSEAMQRERALNRILVAERLEREREAAARGNGLIAMNTVQFAGKPAADKAKPKKKERAPKKPGSKPLRPAP